jgi:hypothetical protein
MKGKKRLSVSVDADVVVAAEAAVKRGAAPTLSAYVSSALRSRVDDDRRLQAARAAIVEYEAEHGEITEHDMERAYRELQSRAIRVRPRRYSVPKSAPRRASEPRSRR